MGTLIMSFDSIISIFISFLRVRHSPPIMENGPVSCLPTTPKMSKAKKVIEEALENQNPELDLADKGVVSFEEMPGLSKCTKFKHFLLWKLVSYLQLPYKDISIILHNVSRLLFCVIIYYKYITKSLN